MSTSASLLDRARDRLARLGAALVLWQTTRPWALLGAALVSVALAAGLASRLTLKTSFGELLPQNKESVLVADKVAERLSDASTLTIVAQGPDKKALQRFIDTLAPAIRALGPGLVGNVDDGVRASQEFFAKHALLYASLDDVKKVHDEIIERYEYEVSKKLDLVVDDGASAPPPLTAEAVRDRVTKAKSAATPSDGPQFPDGYYMEPDGHMIVLLVRTPVSSGDLDKAKVFRARIDDILAKVDPKRFDPAMTVMYTGDFIVGAEEYAKVKDDLAEVGVTGVLMILAVVSLFFLRLRTIAISMLTVGIGVTWTFGFARLTVGHLNSSTGFLVSIIVGNGINFGIIYMARYLEARTEHDAAESLRIAHRETWLATLTAAGAAMVAYGSLVITDFRGFKHFGLIGGAGMLLCWTATYLFLPAMLAASERVWPMKPYGAITSRLRAIYGAPFAFLAERIPRTLTILGVATGIVATALAVHYARSNPMEYDMWNTRNESPKVESSAALMMDRVDKVVGRQGQDGLAIMVDRLDQVLPLKAALDARREAAPANRKPFDRVVTIHDLLPKDQAEKIALVEEARDRLERAHRRKLIKEEDWAELEKYLPAGGVKPIGIGDLPEQVARSFVEKDGTRGRLVYIVPATGRSVWDAHYLIDWADSFRSTPLPDGSVIKGSGRSVIFADLILTVIEDAPKAIVVSFAGTLIILVLAFRGRPAAVTALGTLFLGLAWMIAALALYKVKVGPWAGGLPSVELVGMKLNFLNFVALPISIGVGADYAVNVVQRSELAGPGNTGHVIRETGGAVILCSLTTVLGYFALTFSVNKAIVSFGYAAAAGEVSCLLAAVLVLPAWMVWRDRRRARAAAEAPKVAGAE
jgi:predicted RND superfamily exporter protein